MSEIGRVSRLAFDMMFRGFNAVKNGVLRVPMREMRFASRQNVILFRTVLGCLAMMIRRQLVIFSRRGMMFRATQIGLQTSSGFKGLRQEARHRRHIFLQGIDVPIRIIFIGPFRMIDGLPRMSNRNQRLMRRMGMILAGEVKPRSFPMIPRRRLVMICRGNVMFRRSMLLGHNFTDWLSHVVPDTA
jgi:hypothetical protein